MTIKAMVVPRWGASTPGYYLCNREGGREFCNRLPLPIPKNNGRPMFRPCLGVKEINPLSLWGEADMEENMACPICHPPEKGYLLWSGVTGWDTPELFLEESFPDGNDLGAIVRKVRTIPKNLSVGDIVYVASRWAIPSGKYNKYGEEKYLPGVFFAFRITGIEKVLTLEERKNKRHIRRMINRGITPVIEAEKPYEGELI